MKNKRILAYAIISVVSLSGMAAQAETAYVNDRLYLGVYAEANTEGQASLTVQSGAKLEVLERVDGFARIQIDTGEGGWVRESFIAVEKPASLRIQGIEAERNNLLKKINDLETERTKLQQAMEAAPTDEEVIVIQNDLEKAEAEVIELQALLEEQRVASKNVAKLEAIGAPAIKAKAKPVTKVPEITTLFGVKIWQERLALALIFLLAGAAMGLGFMQQRIKKRFGGYKVW